MYYCEDEYFDLDKGEEDVECQEYRYYYKDNDFFNGFYIVLLIFVGIPLGILGICALRNKEKRWMMIYCVFLGFITIRSLFLFWMMIINLISGDLYEFWPFVIFLLIHLSFFYSFYLFLLKRDDEDRNRYLES